MSVWINISVPGAPAGVLGPFSGAGQFQLAAAGIHEYPTQSAAQAASPQPLNQSQANTVSQVVLEGPGIGSGFGLGQNIGQIGQNVKNAVNSVTSPLAAIGDFFHRLTEAQTWIRVGEFAAGGILIYVGAKAFFPQTIQTVTSTAKKAGKAAKFL